MIKQKLLDTFARVDEHGLYIVSDGEVRWERHVRATGGDKFHEFWVIDDVCQSIIFSNPFHDASAA